MAAMTVRRNLAAREGERAHGDQRVVEAGHHGSHPVNQLETEPEIDQHAEHGVERGQRGLPLQLVAHRGAHHIHLHAARGVEVVVVVRLQRRLHLLAAGVERRLVGLFRQADQHLVVGRGAKGHNRRVLHARRVNCLANRRDVWGMRELHIHLRAAAKIHAQRHRTPRCATRSSSSSQCRPH